jgi:hypothetical protein
MEGLIQEPGILFFFFFAGWGRRAVLGFELKYSII